MPKTFYLEQSDPEIFDLLQAELKRQSAHLEMIASENYTFESVMEAMGSVLTNKYAEGYPFKRYYGGCEVVDAIETLAINRAKKLFNCAFANVQAHSGSQANMAIYHALLKPYDKILSMELNSGGHLSHASKVNITGQHFQGFYYGVNTEGGLIMRRFCVLLKLCALNSLYAGILPTLERLILNALEKLLMRLVRF